MLRMPVVLFTTHGDASAGYTYDDRTGVSYEYPGGRYEAWVKTGERFVYIEGGKGYIGAGVIGQIRPSLTAGRLVCEVLDFDAFLEPVPIRDPATGDQLEADTRVWSTGKVYWSQGVRQLMPDTYERILQLADSTLSAKGSGNSPKPTSAKARPTGKAKYGSPDNNPLVDAIAMDAAHAAVRQRCTGLEVERMPHENPGFDIRVGPAAAIVHHVEVKGTQSSEKVFLMSEGQRKFSAANAPKFSLLVVSGINVKAKTHAQLTWQDGEVTVANADLEPDKWRGRLV